jgi:gamma-glutamyltranspeptidase/glutathione hydrolase
MRLQEALEAPRFVLGCDDEELRLTIEDRFDPSVLAALRRAGHEIEHDQSFGEAGALMRWPRGGVDGGHDPRGDGAALGF